MSDRSVPSPAILTLDPPTPVCINTLTYPAIHTAYIPLPSITASPILLTLPTQAPSTTFAFLYASPNTTTSLLYNGATETLALAPTSKKPALPGTRGVAVVQATHWHALSGYISPPILAHASLTSGDCFSTASFTDLPSLLEGLSGRELTSFCHDRGEYIRGLVRVRYEGLWQGLLGELQLAFLAFSVLLVAEGLERWTRLVGEVCRVDGFLWEGFREGFVAVLEAQLEFLVRCSGDDIVSAIVTELREEFTRFLESFPSTALKGVLCEYGWEPDYGDAPVVVEEG